MGNLGGMEIVVILLVALIVLGPTKLPEAARQVGKAVTEVRRISSGFQRELREAIHEPIQEAEAMARGADVARPTPPPTAGDTTPGDDGPAPEPGPEATPIDTPDHD